MQQYVQDNNGTYPPNLDWGYAPYSYLKNVDIFRCPDVPANIILGQFSVEAPVVSADQHTVSEGVTYPVDYTYNAMRLYEFLPKSIHGVQATLLVNPSTTWLNEDGGIITPEGEYSYSRIVPKTSCGREFVGSTLHSGAGNYSYVDGHVKWLTPEEAGEIECANGPLPAPFKD